MRHFHDDLAADYDLVYADGQASIDRRGGRALPLIDAALGSGEGPPRDRL
ncbi:MULTISPECIES: hypothetical protein [unclassified Streptomyces]|nr:MULTISPECIES: hypothetical protein [unclassified Streptomyces]MYY06308.1 hypothetical protein [Streptomyces sp. SID4913]